ncbi:glycosyltransferase [Thiohalocapsa marina]|uniref:Glycosyltransferase n=1 Tax=Thiohalocapsa marina TaxID=424902 RepID=A0A5M8FQA1_9GAMM|nr:glycosyltransferase [Thiohalocapsa marina]KAA6184645.1 glycosyltransferase [Thiohalocapsa marina]
MNDRKNRLGLLGFRPGPGGIGRVMITLMQALLRQGVAIDLLLPPGETPDVDELGRGLATWTLDTDDAALGHRQLAHYLAVRQPHALLSNRDQAHALLAAHPWTEPRPRIAFRIGTDVPEKLRRSNPLTAPWKARRMASLYRRADLLIGNTPSIARSIRRMLGRGPAPPVEAIWNPIDAERVRRLAEVSTIHPPIHPWITHQQSPLIVSVGRLVRAKDYGTLLRALARLGADDHDPRLIICGEGNQRRSLEALADRLDIADRVDLVGHQTNPFPFMAAADLFVISSLFEGGNNALIEALTLGTPCVSTDCPSGPADLLEAGRLGPLVPVGDHRALAEAMRRTLAAPLPAQSLQAGAERFDAGRAASAYRRALGLAGSAS